MMKFTRRFRNMCFIVLCFAISGTTANATIYTAAVSGNFDAGATWGGLAPGTTISSDIVIIPPGITVTMTGAETFTGSSTLTVLGTLMASPGAALTLASGSLTGTGAIIADSIDLGLTSGFAFTGPITVRSLNSAGANVMAATDLTVTKLLTLGAGTLDIGAGNLTLGHSSTINLTGGTFMSSGSGILGLDSSYNVTYSVSSAIAGPELLGSGIDSITVGTPGTVTLAANTAVNGVLSLTMGTLSLAGNTLTFGPTSNLSAMGTGTITGSATSNVVVDATSGLTGALRFATGTGGELNSLLVNSATGGITLGSALTVNSLLTLTSGALSLGGQTLTLNGSLVAGIGSITGSTTSNLVVNTTGGLTAPLTFTSGSNTLSNLTLNTGTGGVTLSSDLGLSGVLTLTSGSLSLNGNTLTLNPTADISASGTGTITGSATSNLIANTSGSLSGDLRFATGGNLLNNLTVSTGAGTGLSLASNLNLDGMLTLTGGTLSLNGNTLTLNPTGNIATTGTGTITGSATSNLTINTTSGLSGALRLATGTGGVLNNLTVNTTSGGVTLGSALNINNMLTLTSGTLSLNGQTLTLNATGSMGAGTGTLTGSATSNLVVNTTGGLTSPLTFTTGTSMLNNLTINTGTGGVTLSSGLGLSGVLTLTSGTLSLNGNTLTLNPTADVSASGTGAITGSTSSNLIVNTTMGVTGALNFAIGGNTLRNLIVNMGSGTANLMLGSNLTVQDTLSLASGKITLGINNLSLAAGGAVINGSANSYVVTDSTGSLVMNLVAGASDTFKVGSITNYAPLGITANSDATTGNVSVTMANGVLSAGTTGSFLSATEPMVNATWFLESTASTIDYNMVAMWSTDMEVNGFNRENAFISHFTGGAWDAQAPTAAGIDASMYTMTRTGITSLSPFMVRDASYLSIPAVALAGNKVIIFPNPTANTLNYSTTATINRVEISDISGLIVKTANGSSQSISLDGLPGGNYFAHFYGVGVDTVQKFVKE